MISFSEFEKKWRNIPAAKNSYLGLDISHPLDLRVGYHDSEVKSLVVMNPEVSLKIPAGNAIEAKYQALSNGNTVLEFALLNKEYEEEYIRLCWDMIDASEMSKRATQAMIRRYTYWMKLLSLRSESFGFSQQKGLLGELLYLRESMDCLGCEKALSAWQGPDGSDQDFVFETSWTEIKTVSMAADKVKISSMQQLEQESAGELRIYVLEKTTEGPDRYNLVGTVNGIKDVLKDEPHYSDQFAMKLYRYGYREKDIERYKQYYFRLIDIRKYTVADDFPKITRKNADPAIVSCEYEISLPAMEPYRR